MPMAARDAQHEFDNDAVGLPDIDAAVVTDDEYELVTGERLEETVNLTTWKRGVEALQDYHRLNAEIVRSESASAELRRAIRDHVFPLLSGAGAPSWSGVWRLKPDDIDATHRQVLMNGLVEGCDANVHVVNTLALQIIQIAVVGVSYRSAEEAWAHRIFKRDIRVQSGRSPVDIAIDVLSRRSPDDNTTPKRRAVTEMMRRGVMTLMERQVLGSALTAPWRIGHGHPLPYELLTGSGNAKLIDLSLPVLKKLLAHKKFVFVPSDTNDDEVKTIGDALEPLGYAVVKDCERYWGRIAEGHFRGEWERVMRRGLSEFMAKAQHEVLIGTYRASAFAPAQVFYAHRDFVHEAARIAIADSVMLDHRGFPMLIEMADNMCRTYFGAQTLERPVLASFAEAEAPYRHLDERSTRR
jgi:hypothetical protein